MATESVLKTIDISLLGSPKIELDGTAIEVDTRKAIALMAYLAVEEGPKRRESLAALLWPESDTSRGRAALRRTLSALNKALSRQWIHIERDTIELHRGNGFNLDIEQFRELADSFEGHGHVSSEVCGRCEGPLTQALALYQGDFLSGFTLRDSSNFDDWQFYQTEILRRELERVLDRITLVRIGTGNFEKAIESSHRRLALDPLHEATHRMLMRLHAWSGQRSAAMRQYRECVRILDEELKVPPLEETTELYNVIKTDRLSPPTSPRRGYPLEESYRPIEVSEGAGQKRLPLVGREGELASLGKAYQSSSQGGCFVLLEGEVGIGKTRLAEEFLAQLQRQGAPVLSTACYEGESRLAFGPFVEALQSALRTDDDFARLSEIPERVLSEASRLLPEIIEAVPNLPEPGPLDGPGAQARFFEGVRQAILKLTHGDKPGLFFVDDLHLADEATLDLLTFIVRRTSKDQLCVLGSFRSEDLASDHRLRQLMAERQRVGAGLLINLRRLNTSETDELISAAETSTGKIPDEVRARLYEESEGLPFFLNEYLTVIQGALGEGNGVEWNIPETVRGILRSKIASVSSGGMQILTSAAVIGGPFDFEMIRQVSGRGEEEAVEMLEELLAGWLIQEVAPNSQYGEAAYVFRHEKLRAMVYEDLSHARRRLLHRRTAEALHHRDGDAHAGQVAYHYQRAGMEDEAREQFVRSGDYARGLFANREAIGHYTSALELGYPDPAILLEKVGDLRTVLGEYGEAIDHFESAVAYGDADDRARYERKLGLVYVRRGDWEMAERHFEASLGAMKGQRHEEDRALLLSDWALSAFKRGDVDMAGGLASEALDLSISTGDSIAIAQSHNIMGILARHQGDLGDAAEHLQTSFSIAEELGDETAQVAALNNLALVRADEGEFDQGLEVTRKALAISIARGDRHREAALHNNIADLLQASGCTDEAISHVKQSVAIYAEIGVEADEYQPEVWKLVEW